MITTSYAISDPLGQPLELELEVPTSGDPYGALDAQGQKQYYQEQGYVVIRNALKPERCAEAINLFKQLVKPYKGLMYRQTSSGLAERHRFTDTGFMVNSILNPHDLNSRRFGPFREHLLGIYADPAITQVVRGLFSAAPVLVQSMYFEGNPSTWAHQDTYYLDARPLGSLAAAWIALEDIHPGAGRFYVYPGSQRLALPQNTKDLNFSLNHESYKEYIKLILKDHSFACRAPALNAGDVLIWNSFTIHGSLGTAEPARSRNSLTAHYIPAGADFLQFQANPIRLKTSVSHGVTIHHPKDQDRFKNRLVLGIEEMFPRAYRMARNHAIRRLTK